MKHVYTGENIVAKLHAAAAASDGNMLRRI
jgi:hypothetical protein